MVCIGEAMLRTHVTSHRAWREEVRMLSVQVTSRRRLSLLVRHGSTQVEELGEVVLHVLAADEVLERHGLGCPPGVLTNGTHGNRKVLQELGDSTGSADELLECVFAGLAQVGELGPLRRLVLIPEGDDLVCLVLD